LPEYWLFVTDEANWKICLQNETWGTHDGHMKKFQKIKLNDVIIVYLKVLQLAGICVVSKTYYYDDKPLWQDESYPHRIGFKPQNILEEPKNIRNFFYTNFTSDPAGYFRTSIRKIPEDEAMLFLKAINVVLPVTPSSVYSFYLTEEDFQACIRSQTENFIKPLRDKFQNQLKPELLEVLSEDFEDFQTKNSPYVSNAWSRGGYYADHVWIGFAHEKFDNPRNGFQLQFGINRNSIFTFGISVESGSKELLIRRESAKLLRENKKELHKLLNKYKEDYELVAPIDGQELEEKLLEVTEDDIEKWIKLLETKCYFQIRRSLSPQQAIEMGTSIVEYIAETFTELLPLYNLLAIPEDIEENYYFIFRTGGGEYEDVPSRVYHFKEGIPGYKQVLEAENNGEFVFYELDKGGFWAKGKIGNISSEKREGVVHYFIQVENFEEIGPIAFDIIKEQLSLDSIGQAGMRKISKDDYNIILGTPPRRKRVTLEGNFEILSAAHLLSGKNLVIYGPPGTGKTRLAKRIAQIFCGDRFSLVTANAEWSAINVVGGEYISSKEGEVGIRTEFRKGFLSNAAFEGQDKPFWLIIDELNRANLDLAFGEAFTLLDVEHRERTPLIRTDDSVVKEALFLPSSFRLLATINSYDRAALFSLGYAFRRRFAFLELSSPYLTIVEDEPINVEEINWQILTKRENNTLESIRVEISKWVSQQEDPHILDPDRRITNLDSFSSDLSDTINHLANDPLNVYHLFHFLSEWITRHDIVGMGYAQTVDAIKFVLIYMCLVEKNSINLCKAADFSFLSYYLPHLEYFLPKVRREKISRAASEQVEFQKLEKLGNQLRELGLLKSAQKLEVIINRIVKFGETSVF